MYKFLWNKFLWSHVIAKIKWAKINARKLNGRKHYFNVECMCDVMKLEKFRVDVCVGCYHINKDIWYAVVREVLVCEREPNNSLDRYAVAVNK